MSVRRGDRITLRQHRSLCQSRLPAMRAGGSRECAQWSRLGRPLNWHCDRCEEQGIYPCLRPMTVYKELIHLKADHPASCLYQKWKILILRQGDLYRGRQCTCSPDSYMAVGLPAQLSRLRGRTALRAIGLEHMWYLSTHLQCCSLDNSDRHFP